MTRISKGKTLYVKSHTLDLNNQVFKISFIMKYNVWTHYSVGIILLTSFRNMGHTLDTVHIHSRSQKTEINFKAVKSSSNILVRFGCPKISTPRLWCPGYIILSPAAVQSNLPD